jgi:hypothetical protein
VKKKVPTVRRGPVVHKYEIKKSKTTALLLKRISEPLTNSPQTLPTYSLIAVLHELHDSSLETQLFQLLSLLGHFLDETSDIVAPNSQHLLVVFPVLCQNLGQLLDQIALVVFEDSTRIVPPEGLIAMGWRPAEVARVEFGFVLGKGVLGLLEVFDHFLQCFHVLEEIGIVQVTTLQVLKDGGEASGNNGGHECVAVSGQEVGKSGEQESCCLFLGRDAKKRGVEDDYVVFSVMMLAR